MRLFVCGGKKNYNYLLVSIQKEGIHRLVCMHDSVLLLFKTKHSLTHIYISEGFFGVENGTI